MPALCTRTSSPTGLGGDRGCDGLPLVGVGDVERQPPWGSLTIARGVGLRERAVGRVNAGALGGEGARDAGPDAGGRAGDQDNAVRESHGAGAYDCSSAASEARRR